MEVDFIRILQYNWSHCTQNKKIFKKTSMQIVNLYDIFRQKVKEWVTTQNRPVRALEKQIGISPGTMANILSHKNHNHRMSNIILVANALGWSLDEIFCREAHIQKKPIAQTEDKVPLNAKLFENTLKFILNFFSEHSESNPSLAEIQQYLSEIYKYCFFSAEQKLDKNFANWFLVQKLNSKEKI